jgi:hypothetical protein
MSDPHAIARLLTKTQRDALFHVSEKPWSFPLRWNVLVGYGLEVLGLTKRSWLLDRTRITPLGLAVRKIIEDGETTTRAPGKGD